MVPVAFACGFRQSTLVFQQHGNGSTLALAARLVVDVVRREMLNCTQQSRREACAEARHQRVALKQHLFRISVLRCTNELSINSFNPKSA